jgi:hypothetical protein
MPESLHTTLTKHRRLPIWAVLCLILFILSLPAMVIPNFGHG